MRSLLALCVAISMVLLYLPLNGEVDARLLRDPDVSKSHITFVYAGDVWIVAKEGGMARQLSSPKGEELYPRFSPDGSMIAFSGNYDGNIDVYVIPVNGGMARRVTHHPEPDLVEDWYPDGKALMYRSGMASFRSFVPQFYKTSPDGGMPERLPVPYGMYGALSDDGLHIAFSTISNVNRSWKRHRGGRAGDIWVMDLATSEAVNITGSDANDDVPMWRGDKIYFLSDRAADMRSNIWVYDMKTKQSRQVTFFREFDVNWPEIGPDEIVFENGGQLHLLNLETEKSSPVKITVATDLASLRPRVEKVAKLIRHAGISPSGKRVVLEARGEIFSVPAEHGPVLNLTQSSGVAERYPAWSPDGKWIAYCSDRSGEYQLITRPADRMGSETVLTSYDRGFRYNPQWSPDSKKLAFLDEEKNLNLMDIATKKIEVIDRLPEGSHYSLEDYEVSFSADGRYIAYYRNMPNNNYAVFIYDVKEKKSRQVTSGFCSEWDPVFDPDGKYLYFVSLRSFTPIYSSIQATWIYGNGVHVMAMALQADIPSPLEVRNDQEGEETKKPSDSKKEKPKPAAESRAIDWQGIENRIVTLTGKAGNYENPKATSGKVLYISWSFHGAPERKGTLVYYDLKSREEQTVLENVSDFDLSADGKKILVANRGSFGIVNVAPKQKMTPLPGIAEMEMIVDPRQEWRQLFNDSWRFERDFFYDANTHGLDWRAMRKQYGKLLEDAVTREDVSFVIRELVGELGAGHVFVGGGDVEKPEQRNTGMLGVDFSLRNGAFQIEKIIDVSSQNIGVRSPLREPGVNISIGDYILAVNGVTLDTTFDPWAGFQGLGGKTAMLTVNDRPSLDGARDVPVTMMTDERALRELAWVEANRQAVAEATDGRVGYIYVPNTGTDGQSELVRQFRAQFHLQGLVIDERFNTGGQLGDRFVELLNRPLYNYMYERNGNTNQFPAIANTGPKVMLANGWSGSGGDALPFYFQLAKIGPVIGTRTWGGLVGPAYGMPLIDGGYVSCPPGRFVGLDGEWVVENVGVIPDILLPNDPGRLAKGDDQQLNRAVEEILAALKKNPPTKPRIPEFPVVKRD